MDHREVDIAVAGHICADLIPDISLSGGRADELITPGRLVQVGPLSTALGGVVGNTGVALHRLGFSVALVGKVGDDVLGSTILELLRRRDPALAESMIVAPGEPSSYTIVISPPRADRSFLHCPGVNDTFAASEISSDRLGSARLIHFGYPPLMQRIFADGGEGLAAKFAEIRQRGTLVSLDMAMPDPAAPAGKVDWHAWMATVLPHVDLFLPSFDEVLLMLDPQRYKALANRASGANPARASDGPLLDELSTRLLDLGARLVVLKLGDQGLYLRTGADFAGLEGPAARSDSSWRNRQLLAPCFDVEVVGATGSGDCAIAGLLSAVVRRQTPPRAVLSAVGLGACNVQSADATSNIPRWDAVQEQIEAWRQKPIDVELPGWQRDDECRVFVGPRDQI